MPGENLGDVFGVELGAAFADAGERPGDEPFLERELAGVVYLAAMLYAATLPPGCASDVAVGEPALTGGEGHDQGGIGEDRIDTLGDFCDGPTVAVLVGNRPE